MVLWQARGPAGGSAVSDLYSTGYHMPSWDEQQDYSGKISYNDSWTVFETKRLLTTNDNNDYIINKGDYGVNMIWAFVDSTADIRKHYQDNRGRMTMKVKADGSIEFELVKLLDIALIAGWLSFVAWSVLGLIQITSFRYTRKYWRYNNWTHAISGSIVCLETVIVGFVGAADGYHISFHVVLGFVIMAIVTLLSLWGFVAWWFSNYTKWQSLRVFRYKQVHRVRSIFNLIYIFYSMLATF